MQAEIRQESLNHAVRRNRARLHLIANSPATAVIRRCLHEEEAGEMTSFIDRNLVAAGDNEQSRIRQESFDF